MEWITSIVNYVTTHWQDMIEVYLQVIGAASILVKLTPTLKDDDVLKGIVRFFGKYIALNTSKGSTPSA
jgi:hypothetical protein